jgi:glycyl-tRNA synthetase
VILKPEPGNAQELYLRSLAALGIDTAAHDVRFVEDNWESPVLGAWGLGWEVWLDGMEVTQFTYFQQAGSLPLKPAAVEITYGLERILMALQGVNHFRDIAYNEHLSYGEAFLQNEYEMSRYNLEVADVAAARTRFALHADEANALVAARLPLPAYDCLLKASHAFNVLDARGAVGVTERAELFARMRGAAREIAKLWLERRTELGFPLLAKAAGGDGSGDNAGTATSAGGAVSTVPAASVEGQLPGAPATFILELGSEELPAADVASAGAQLAAALPALLARLRLSHGAVRAGATPRRLSVVVSDLAAAQAPKAERVRGPPAKAARNAAGAWTPAAEGFARKAGVPLEALLLEADEKGTSYAWADVTAPCLPAAQVLASELPALVASISFPRTMRWNGDATYARPLRWLLALHGGATLHFSALGVASGGVTRVLRTAAAPVVPIASADAYEAALAAAGITSDAAARRAAIASGAAAAAAAAGGVVPPDEALLEEVTNLVESPFLVSGTFDPAFLALPKEVLIMVMRKHQRYFPVVDATSGALLPAFITAANGPCDAAAVRAGNEAVLRARYEDARFFYEADCKQPLAAFRPALATTIFEKRLGNMLQKSDRTEALVPIVAAAMKLGEADAADAVAAAHLARADLATALVMEFTGLAGVMGRHYATRGGVAAPIATAIYEAALPRAAGDALPGSPAGIAVAVADRVDSLVGLFAVGGAPSATADPFGLRRAAYGAVDTLVGNDMRLDLRPLIAAAAAAQPVPAGAEVQAEVLTFITR